MYGQHVGVRDLILLIFLKIGELILVVMLFYFSCYFLLYCLLSDNKLPGSWILNYFMSFYCISVLFFLLKNLFLFIYISYFIEYIIKFHFTMKLLL